MNMIVEVALEFILLGTIDAIPSKKIPMFLRVLLATILLTVYIGLTLLLFVAGIQSKDLKLIFVAGLILFLVAVLILPKVKHIRSKSV